MNFGNLSLRSVADVVGTIPATTVFKNATDQQWALHRDFLDSQLIIDGRIKVKQGVEVDRLQPGEVVFIDDSVMPFDMVVVAVGFGNMQETVRRLFGDEVADRVGPIWGIGEDGELRAMWRPTGQRGFWVTGGSFTQSRSYSRVLAFQILARDLGMVARS